MTHLIRLLVLTLCFTFLLPSDLMSQKKNRSIIKADKLFEAELYFDACELYKKGYKKTNSKHKGIKAEILFKQAECYRLMSKSKLSANFYRKSIKAKYNNSDAIAILRYAQMLMASGNYEKALEQFKKYEKKVPNDPKGEKGRKSCEFAIDWMANPTDYVVKAKDVINSRGNDFSPAFGNRDYTKIFFVSSRKGSSNDQVDLRTGEYFTDIYSSSLNKKGEWRRHL